MAASTALPYLGFYRIDWFINHVRIRLAETHVKAEVFVFKKTVMMNAWESKKQSVKYEKAYKRI